MTLEHRGDPVSKGGGGEEMAQWFRASSALSDDLVLSIPRTNARQLTTARSFRGSHMLTSVGSPHTWYTFPWTQERIRD